MKETHPCKQFFSLVLSLVMVLSLFSVNVSAAETLPELSQAALNISQSGLSYDDFGYKVNSDGATVTITSCSKTDSEITVPAKIDGKAVTVIGKESFFHCSYTKITLPEGILTIEASAFEHSPKLERVNIENIEPLGHSYGEPTYTWSDDNKTFTAKRVCANDDAHVETETASVTSTITKKPTCDEKGETTYTAVFENTSFEKQTKTEQIKPTGHKWGAPVWTWEGVTSASASFTCENDAGHTITVKAEISSAVTTKPTQDKEGVRTYTARVTLGDTGYTDSITEAIPKLKPVQTPDKPTPVPDKPTPTPDKPIPVPDKPTPTPDEPIGLLGDVNSDGTVDSADALLILRNSVGLEAFDDTQNLLGDVNGDNTVDSADALDVLRYSVGLSANENMGKPVMKADYSKRR